MCVHDACDHGKHRNGKWYNLVVTVFKGAKQKLEPKPRHLAKTTSLHNSIIQTM